MMGANVSNNFVQVFQDKYDKQQPKIADQSFKHSQLSQLYSLICTKAQYTLYFSSSSIDFLMKHKNELRWLAFLLIPFNILFALHIITPLQFISNNGSMLQYYAGQEQMSMYRYTTTSYIYFSRRTLNNLFQRYVFNLNAITKLVWSSNQNSSYIHYKNQNTTALNAFQIYSQANRTSANRTSFNASMWFATGYQKQSQLPVNLKALLQQYLRIDVYIRQLTAANIDQLVYSFIYYSVDANQSIFFQFPAKQQPKYANISASVKDYYYNQTMNVYLANNKSLSIVPFIEHQITENIDLLILCRPSIKQKQSKVICLKLRADQLEYQIRSNFSPLNFSQLNFTYYLIMNPDFLPPNSQPTYIIFGEKEDKYSQSIGKIKLNEKSKIGQQNIIKRYKVLYYFQINFTVYFISPITIDTFNVNSTQYFLVCQIQLDPSVVLNQKLAINFPELLLPVTLLVIFASIVNAYIVKLILNSIQRQLCALDQPCQLIVQGNLDVQIADFQGAKEIKELYRKIKIINKIHRYSTQNYFTGHFSSKLLKYAEALQLLKELNYDPGNLLQNMGEAYTHIEQWKKGRDALKQSITLTLEQIEKDYGSVNEITKLKKERKLPFHYKQLEQILIRRLFKLTFNYLIYLQQKPSFLLISKKQSTSQSLFDDKKELGLNRQCLYYLKMLKMAFYPQFSSHSQAIIMLYYEAKQVAMLSNFAANKSSFNRIDKILEIYTQEYYINRKLSKQKSQLNHKQKQVKKIHQLKRKPLSHYSKVHPDILKAFKNYFLFQIKQIERNKSGKYICSINELCQCLTTEVISIRLNYLTLYYLRKLLIQLDLDTLLLQSTQIFRQMMPFSGLHYGERTEDAEHQLYKFPTQYSSGLQRQFILIFDCGKNYVENDQKLVNFHAERVGHLHEKLIKPTDRVSIMKFNARRGVEVECKLLMKQSSDFLLRKSVNEIVRERSSSGNLCPGLIEVLLRSVDRVKHLRSEKVIVLFFRSVQQYKQQMGRVHRSHFEKYPAARSSVTGVLSDEQQLQVQERFPERFGEWVEYILQEQEIRNLKLILYCAKEDSRSDLVNFFGLKDINARIWGKNDGVNVSNNLVYIIQDKYRNDIDRILMLKAQLIPDNHIFIF